MTEEKVKRLTPTKDTVRRLFSTSGNLCAYSNCKNIMINADGVFVGEICHIEAAEEGGERFNPKMTNEERRSFGNLMLMCGAHHKVTNNVKKFPVEKLKEIKEGHERKFSHPDRAILTGLVDWTTLNEPTKAKNLKNLSRVLDVPEYAADEIEELNLFIDQIRSVPFEVLKFIADVTGRILLMENTPSVQIAGISDSKILVSDVKGAFRLSDQFLKERLIQLESYRLGGIGEMDTNMGNQDAICIDNLSGGWPFWLDFVLYCQKNSVDVDAFLTDLDFSRFDE